MQTANSHHYLLEVGTEELPVSFLKTAPCELEEKVKALLDDREVSYQSVSVYATPRRLTLDITGLPTQQKDRKESVKGPPLRIAVDSNGKPTKAGEGFAKKMSVSFETLQQDTTDGETYLVFETHQKGRLTSDILTEQLPQLILSLNGSHFMAWGTFSIRFSRPIRWLLSLWNTEHLPINIGPVQSSQDSYGNRLLANHKISVQAPDTYASQLLESGHVIVQAGQRKALIYQQLKQSATTKNACLVENPELLDTVTMLVEHPTVMIGEFNRRFLHLPSEVIQTVMTAHQKYFALQDSKEQLLPYFLIVSNGNKAFEQTICRGNEKVIAARLADAAFFFEEDKKKKLADYVQNLNGITFQRNLGSMADKTLRLEQLTVAVTSHLGYSQNDTQFATRAAHLAKADLVTSMVFELTELQGVMGQHYAKCSGESEEVATAILEHYRPCFTGDEIAASKAGIAVSLADKLDTITAIFSQQNAKLPSGSKDPLGLRRMATGIIQTILEHQLQLDLIALLSVAYRNLIESPVGKSRNSFRSEEETITLISDFILQRLKGLLLEQEFRYDVIEVVLEAEKKPLGHVSDVLTRCQAVKNLTKSQESLLQLYEPANRVHKILGTSYKADVTPTDINIALFNTDQEHTLLKVLQTLCNTRITPVSPTDYSNWITAAKQLNEPVQLFFEAVMVNDSDAQVRNNRYNLLSMLHKFYMQVGCFSKLSQMT